MRDSRTHLRWAATLNPWFVWTIQTWDKQTRRWQSEAVLLIIIMALALGCHSHTAPPSSMRVGTLICEQQAVVQDMRTEAYLWAQYLCTAVTP